MPAAIRNPTPEWLKAENASVFDPAWKRIARAAGHLIGADDPQAQVLGLMAPLVPEGQATVGPVVKAAQAVAGKVKASPVVEALTKRIKAFHGSPHDFAPEAGAPLGRFKSANIGTGEGAQAYGHGLYFAENEATARAYRDDLAKAVPAFGGTAVATPAESMAHDILSKYDPSAAMKVVDDYAKNGIFKGPNEAKAIAAVREAITRNSGKVADVAKQGKMYEVGINADPAQMLDWDTPLRGQPAITEKFKTELDAMRQSRVGQASQWGTPSPEDLAAYTTQADEQVGNLTGRDLYEHIADGTDATNRGSMPYADRRIAASERLKQSGIPGIKYLDQGSRADGAGTSNYVMFDDKIIDIMRKYGVLGAAGLGAASQPDVRQQLMERMQGNR